MFSFYLINKDIGQTTFSHYIRGGGYIHPFHKAFLRLNVFCLKRLYCFTVFCQCIDIKHTFKGKYIFLKIAAIGEHHASFLSISYYHYAT